MRKIDKSEANILSKKYYDWQKENASKTYDSSNNRFYKDVVLNLLFCQRGVCAYTEMHLCKEATFDKTNWKDGNYKLIINELERKPEYFGSLDHFDPNLKTTQGWLWSNFFMTHKDINERLKKRKQVDLILKPDLVEYDVFKILDYDIERHLFIPNVTNLSEDEIERVKTMILTLGINYEPVVDQREKILNPILKRVNRNIETWEEAEEDIFQFFTAFQFCKEKLTTIKK